MTRRQLIAALAALLVLVAGGVLWRQSINQPLPDGIVVGNGRIEADKVEIAPKYPGRLDLVNVKEGDLVEAGELLAHMESGELEAALAGARASAALAQDALVEARAVRVQREAELKYAEQELGRALPLVDRGHLSPSLFDQRRTARDVAAAALEAGTAHVATSERRIAVADAEVARLERQLDASDLEAPMNGRVLYLLAKSGEVLPAGGPVLTLLDLDDVYMEIFLAAGDAGLLPLGSEARIVLDVLPDYAIPATVSFVSPEAQFTPKQVETLAEREKLVFRVRVRIPRELVADRIAYVKTGLRGVAYVRLKPSVAWPENLERRIPPELFE